MASSSRSRRYPLPLVPNGWYCVATSESLRRGGVLPLHYFGHDMVAYRGEEGAVHVLDAYCAHLGVHLGHGGKVVGDTIRSPAHGWRYDGDGRCVHVPYAERTPEAHIRAWPVREVNGLVLVYHHERGEPPSYTIPQLSEHGAPEWSSPSGFVLRPRSHVQEMWENLVDRSHFRFLHGLYEPPDVRLETDGPLATVRSRLKKRVLGSTMTYDFVAECHGPGYQVIRQNVGIPAIMLVLVTPVDPDECELRIVLWAKVPRWIPLAGSLVNRAYSAFVKQDTVRDIGIWDRKIYLEKPCLSSVDAEILQFRRWYAQFYDGEGVRVGATASVKASSRAEVTV